MCDRKYLRRKRSAPDTSEEPDSDNDMKTEPSDTSTPTFTVECPICLEEMDEPKLLHCGHNLCQTCAAKTGKITKERTVHIFKLECPLCKSVTSLSALSGLNTNIELRNTIEKTKKMKLDMEAQIAELKAKIAAETIKCAECSLKMTPNDAFACGHDDCATNRLVSVEWPSKRVNICTPKALCSQCAMRSHRRHVALVWKWTEFTSKKDLLDMARELGEMTMDVDEIFDPLKNTGPIGNLFDEIISEWKDETNAANQLFSATPLPMLNDRAERRLRRVKKLYKRIKEFVGGETTELRTLTSQFRHEINRRYKRGMSSRSLSRSPSRAWSSPRESRGNCSRSRSYSPASPRSEGPRSRNASPGGEGLGSLDDGSPKQSKKGRPSGK